MDCGSGSGPGAYLFGLISAVLCAFHTDQEFVLRVHAGKYPDTLKAVIIGLRVKRGLNHKQLFGGNRERQEKMSIRYVEI